MRCLGAFGQIPEFVDGAHGGREIFETNRFYDVGVGTKVVAAQAIFLGFR